MASPLEYHKFVNRSVTRSIPASPAVLGMLFFLVCSSSAQSSGGAANSSAHSGSAAPYTGSIAPPTAFHVAPPTGATSVHNGFVPAGSNVSRSSGSPHSPGSSHISHDGQHHPHHTANGTAYYPYVYAVPVPYAVDVSDADNSDDDDAEYQGGPTVIDRRGSGPDSYVPPSSAGPAHARDAEDAPVAQSDPEPPQPPTTLVFKDGRQLEVNNYAIVSQTLYDLTSGHPRKIALADLDLPATEKQNDDHGVTFQLPPSAQAN